MPRLFIQCVNAALLVIIFIGVPAITRAQFGNVQIGSAPKLRLLLFWGLALALLGNVISAWFVFKKKPQRKLCWEWAAVFGGLLLAYCAYAFGYLHFDWLRKSLLWLQEHV